MSIYFQLLFLLGKKSQNLTRIEISPPQKAVLRTECTLNYYKFEMNNNQLEEKFSIKKKMAYKELEDSTLLPFLNRAWKKP